MSTSKSYDWNTWGEAPIGQMPMAVATIETFGKKRTPAVTPALPIALIREFLQESGNDRQNQ